jgi:hypothetical protein
VDGKVTIPLEDVTLTDAEMSAQEDSIQMKDCIRVRALLRDPRDF